MKGVEGQAEDISWQTRGGGSGVMWLWNFELGNDLVRCDLPSYQCNLIVQSRMCLCSACRETDEDDTGSSSGENCETLNAGS